MHWVLQKNIYGEQGWIDLVEALKARGLPWSVHTVVPFVGELIPDIQPMGRVICIGSYAMRRVAGARGWNPGVYDIHDTPFPIQREHWGDHMLNADAEIGTFGSFIPRQPLTFMRPIDDGKQFAGMVLEKDEFLEWQRKVVTLGEDEGVGLSKDTLILAARPKNTYAEWRFWVVDGRVVTGSEYKVGDTIRHSSDVDAAAQAFAEEMLRIWFPLRAFCLDICAVLEGFRIVEINTINASGFYAADVARIVDALEMTS